MANELTAQECLLRQARAIRDGQGSPFERRPTLMHAMWLEHVADRMIGALVEDVCLLRELCMQNGRRECLTGA
jgi:hypothetical protein